VHPTIPEEMIPGFKLQAFSSRPPGFVCVTATTPPGLPPPLLVEGEEDADEVPEESVDDSSSDTSLDS